jgi:hypothetical protein
MDRSATPCHFFGANKPILHGMTLAASSLAKTMMGHRKERPE